MTRFHLFPTVHLFYTDLCRWLRTAQQTIHMAYYAFDDGRWAQTISHILAQRAAQGVAVHLLVDEAGLALDNVRHAHANRQLVRHLRASGVRVDLFRPHGRRLSQFNRLHCKFCAIDGQMLFIGGSNIGDHYLGWRDSNLRLDGPLGPDIIRLYEGLCQFGGHLTAGHPFRGDQLQVAGLPLLLTVPGRRQDIRRALLDLILSAHHTVTLRSWYFLPDTEIINALLCQAEAGVCVSILFSHHTRIPFIDIANRRLCRQLTAAGVHVYRYRGQFMHAKEAWNDQNDILFGSANIDRWALRTNFECCLRIHHQPLANDLVRAFHADLAHCRIPGTAVGRLA